ncbi:unnamed protein product [Prunus armeniaca]
MLSTTPGAYTLVALSEHPYDIGARNLTILDGLGLGSTLFKIEGRYSDAGTRGLRPHAMHRWLCGTFGIHMLPRLGRHASMTACVYSLRMWAIVDAKGMTDRSVVDVSYATLDVWASRVHCRMRSDCIVTCGRRLTGIRRDPGPHGCALEWRNLCFASAAPRRSLIP